MSTTHLNDHPFQTIELIAQVAEIVYDCSDLTTLKSCTLVCHSWRTACRLYIFRRIRIVTEDSLNAFDAFLDIDPTIGPLVRELTIQPERHTLPEPVEWVANFPSKLSSKLVNLEALQLAQLYELGEYLLDPFFHDLTQLRSVTRLTVRDSSLALRMIFAFASALPSLHDLRIGSMSAMPTNRWDPPPNLFDPCLSSVELHVDNTFPRAVQDTLTWLLSTNSRERLNSLSVLVYFSHVPAVMDALRMLGAQLRHLELRFGLVFGSHLEYQMIKDELDLDSCCGLRSITFRSPNPACQAIVSLLGEICSPYIRTVTFHISDHDPAAFPNCKSLDAALNGANLVCVEEACFIYEGPLSRHQVLERLREDLPTVGTRGLLRVVSG